MWVLGRTCRLGDFHDRSLSRGQKLSRRATEDAGVNPFLIPRRVCCLSAVVPILDEPDFHLLSQTSE